MHGLLRGGEEKTLHLLDGAKQFRIRGTLVQAEKGAPIEESAFKFLIENLFHRTSDSGLIWESGNSLVVPLGTE